MTAMFQKEERLYIEYYVAADHKFDLWSVKSVRMSICFKKRVSGSSNTVENASNATLIASSPEMKHALAALGSATVAVLSLYPAERPFAI